MVLLFAQRELNTIMGDVRDDSTANFITGGNVEFLTDLGAQHSRQMRGMFADQGGGVSVYFVGDPAAACHESVASSQSSVSAHSKSICRAQATGYWQLTT